MNPGDYRSRWPELIKDLVDKAEHILIQTGVDTQIASVASRQIADAMRKDWGGQFIYFPKGDSIELTVRDLELYNKWDGTSKHLAELCQKYSVSLQWGYKIVKAVRAADNTQSDLFK